MRSPWILAIVVLLEGAAPGCRPEAEEFVSGELAEAQAEQIKQVGDWLFVCGADELTDTHYCVARTAGEVTGELTVSCKDRGPPIIVFFSTTKYLGSSSQTVRWRVDNNPMVEEYWLVADRSAWTTDLQTRVIIEQMIIC